MILNEVTRQQHMSKTMSSDDYALNNQQYGKNRYDRRLRQRVSSSTAEYNRIDMNKLFNQGILDVNILVHGETNDYTVRISFGDIVDNLQNEIKLNNDQFTLRSVLRALIRSFNGDDVKVRCNCADATYRQNYWLSQNGAIAGTPETRPSNETNPHDTKGSGCKHVQMVLSNNGWLQKVAAVIYNYTNYMKEHYTNLYGSFIYPILYNKDYEEPTQLDMFEPSNINSTDMDTGQPDELIDTANKWAKTKTQFKKGWNNKSLQLSDDEQNIQIPGQKSFDFDSLISDT